MPDSPSVAGEAAEGVRSLFSRLGEFFHIFDLSFLVSGVTTLGALLFLHYRLGFSAHFPVSGWITGFGLIMAAYVCGLVSFSAGRALNTKIYRKRRISYLTYALIDQKLQGRFVEHVTEFFQRNNKNDQWRLWRLYARLWQQLAEKHPNSAAFRHVHRYWAMAATYDGVAVSLLVWAIAVAPIPLFGNSFLPLKLALLASAVLIASALLCLWQGAKYYEFQIEDLVAALAVMGSTVE